MLRQLLTLLAVISGFTLAAEPVSAAQGAVVSMASVSEIADAQPSAFVIEERPGLAENDAASYFEAAEQRIAIPAAPAIRLRADRSRE